VCALRKLTGIVAAQHRNLDLPLAQAVLHLIFDKTEGVVVFITKGKFYHFQVLLRVKVSGVCCLM